MYVCSNYYKKQAGGSRSRTSKAPGPVYTCVSAGHHCYHYRYTGLLLTVPICPSPSPAVVFTKSGYACFSEPILLQLRVYLNM